MGAPTLQGMVILVDGILAGVFVGSSMVEHAARSLPAPAWIAYKQAKESVFGRWMPALFGSALALTTAGTALLPSRTAPALAAAMLGAVLLVTLLVHVPLNRRFQSWNETAYAATWNEERRRWRQWSLLRAALVVAAFALLVARR